MFGLPKANEPKRQKNGLDDILARHNANLAAERKTPSRSDVAVPAVSKKAEFGKRRG